MGWGGETAGCQEWVGFVGGQWEVAYHWVVLVCRFEKKNDIKGFWKRTWRVSGSPRVARTQWQWVWTGELCWGVTAKGESLTDIA